MPTAFLKRIKAKLLGRSRPSQSKPAQDRPAGPAAVSGSTTPPVRPSSGSSRRRPQRSREPAAPAAAWTVDMFAVPPREGSARFHDLDLPVELMHAVADLGFEYCTPIQAQTLEPSMKGRNVAGRAQTGTGKTAAFLIAGFTRFLRDPAPGDRACGTPRMLVLAPTRELVLQIVKDAESLGKYCPFRALAVYGGMDFKLQQRILEDEQVDVVAATPGRLLDFVRRRVINLKQVEMFVIDEADRMLDMGFIPDVRRIVHALPPRERRQGMLFSATLTEDVRRLAAQWMPDPVVAEVEPDQVAVDTVDQQIYVVASDKKFAVLYNLLKRPEVSRVLVFGNRRDQTQRLAERLEQLGVKCELLSGSVPQKKRVRILEAFRAGKVPVLVATDVAGRGLHVEGISHVINYDFPYEPEDYVHRIGRTGRAGSAGVAISFACEHESFIVPEIEKYIGEELVCVQPAEELLVPPPRPGGSAGRRSRHSSGPPRERGRGDRGRSGHGRRR